MRFLGYLTKFTLFIWRFGLVIALIAACAPEQPPIEIPTLWVLPTITPSPIPPTSTWTPQFTETPSPTPTITPSPTATNTPTVTPSPTPSATPTPVYGAFGTWMGDLSDDANGITAEFASAFERHVYTFMGRAGERITLRMRTINEEINPALLLIDPLGNRIAADDNAGATFGLGENGALLNGVMLMSDGVYAVQSLSGGFAGRYHLVLERNVPPALITAPPPTATATAFVTAAPLPAEEDGQLIEGVPAAGEIDRAGELDRLFIAAEAGNALTITVRIPTGSGLRPRIEVYDLDGLVIAMTNLGSSGASNTVIASPVFITETGSYGVYITGENNTTGAYTAAYGVGTYTQTRVMGALMADVSTGATFDQPGLSDLWTFDARAGDRVTIEASVVDLVVELNAPDGSNIGRFPRVLEGIALPQTGTYQVRLSVPDARAVGTYTLVYRLDDPAPTPTPLRESAVILDFDLDLAADAVIELPFFGQVGWEVEVNVYPINAVDPIAALVAPDGAIIAENDDSGGTSAAWIESTLVVDGTYQVRVRAYGGGGQVRVTVIARPAA